MTASRRRAVAVSLVVLLAPSLVAPAAAGGAPPAAAAGPPDAFDLQQVDADDVLLEVALQPDGDAVWTVEYRVRLETDNETAAFRSLREDIRSNPDNFTERFGDRMRSTAAAAENATGREMSVRNVSVTARIQEVPTYGIVTYTFEWTNFAVVDGDRLRAGDALTGLFLDERTRLRIRWPSSYELASVTPSPAETGARSVTWTGPTEFGGDGPRVVVRKPGPLSGRAPLLVGGAVAVAVVAGVAWWFRDRLPVGGPAAGGTESATVNGSPDAGTDDGPGTDQPPEELLSNEERVLKFVREQGGRVKQQEIVDAMDWTEAKTSQVVRDLRDEGDLEGFRLGRENVLRLPEVDDTSPLDDDE